MKLWSSPTVGIIRTSIHHPENHWTLLWRGLTLHTKVLGSPNHHFWDPMILRASNFHSLSLNKFNQNIRWSLVERFTFTTLHWTDVKQVIYQIGRTSFFCEMSSELKTTCWISLNFVDEQKTIELEIWDELEKCNYDHRTLSTSQGATGVESAVSATCCRGRNISRDHSGRDLFSEVS